MGTARRDPPRISDSAPLRSRVTTPQLQQTHSSCSMLLFLLIYTASSSYFPKCICQRQLGKSLVSSPSLSRVRSLQNVQMNGIGRHKPGHLIPLDSVRLKQGNHLSRRRPTVSVHSLTWHGFWPHWK